MQLPQVPILFSVPKVIVFGVMVARIWPLESVASAYDSSRCTTSVEAIFLYETAKSLPDVNALAKVFVAPTVQFTRSDE